jgi:PAS domain-containing protein
MVTYQEQTITHWQNDDGLIIIDAAGHVVRTNPQGQAYLALLGDAGTTGTLTHLGREPLERLLVSPPVEQANHQLVLIGPPRQVFNVVAQPVVTGSRVDGWMLLIREDYEEEEEASPQQPEETALVIHWPPAWFGTSNRL